MRPTLPRLNAFRGFGEDGDFVYFRVPRRRRSCPGAAKEPEWAAGTRRHWRDDSTSVAHRAKEEVSSRVAASPRRIGSADPSSRLGSWSRVAPRLPQKTLKSPKNTLSSQSNPKMKLRVLCELGVRYIRGFCPQMTNTGGPILRAGLDEAVPILPICICGNDGICKHLRSVNNTKL